MVAKMDASLKKEKKKQYVIYDFLNSGCIKMYLKSVKSK